MEVGLLQNFCEILYCPETREAAIVDPAWEVDRLLRRGRAPEAEGDDRAHHPHPQRPHRGRRPARREDRRRRGRQPARGRRRARARAHARRRGRRPRHRHRQARRARARDARPHRRRHLLPGRRLRRDRRRAVRRRLRPHRLPGRRHRRDVEEPAAADAPARGDARLPRPRLRRDADLDDRARDPDQPRSCAARRSRSSARCASASAPETGPWICWWSGT